MELTPAIVPVPLRLDGASVDAFTTALDAAVRGPAPVVVLRAPAPGTFCLGLAIDDAGAGPASAESFAAVLTALHRAPKPLLAVVEGEAIGGGLGLTCACDWVLATPEARFGLPELVWGLLPAMIWPVIADRMAPHVARQWTIAAHTRTVDEAVAAGVVDAVVAADRLEPALRRAVRTLARLEPSALPRLRAWMRDSRALPLADAVAAGAAITGRMMTDATVLARWRAFAEGGVPWSA